MQEPSTASRTVKCARLRCAAILALIAFGLFSLFMWTAGLAVGWHLIRGNFISFEGQKIRVPWDMFALHSEDQRAISMVRWAAPIPILRSPAGMIFISRRPVVVIEDQKYLDRLAIAFAESPKGYRLKAVRKLTVRKGTATCWEHLSVDSSSMSINCLFDTDTISASFEGSPSYRDPFYRALGLVLGATSPAQ